VTGYITGSKNGDSNETSIFRRVIWLILPHSSTIEWTMRTVFVVFVLALIAIAFEAYSDVALTSAGVSHTASPDPATAAITHGLKHG
jgi:hypothetical protein